MEGGKSKRGKEPQNYDGRDEVESAENEKHYGEAGEEEYDQAVVVDEIERGSVVRESTRVVRAEHRIMAGEEKRMHHVGGEEKGKWWRPCTMTRERNDCDL